MIERVVLGCALFGGLGSLPELRDKGVTRNDAFQLMDAAWDLGIRRFDTADAYGGGTSETWIGEWRRRSGKDVRVTTKTFNPMDKGADYGLSRTRVRRQLSESLRRLRTEAVDVYLAHEWDDNIQVGDVVATFRELVDEGYVRTFGFSNISIGDLQSVISVAVPAVVQNSYSLLLHVDDVDVIPTCVNSGSAFEAYSPLAGGWLTGKYLDDPSPTDSRMALVPQWYRHIEPRGAAAGVRMLRQRAVSIGISTAGLAIGWVLHNVNIARVVVGPKRLDQLTPVIEACSITLSGSDRDELAAYFTPVTA